MIHNYSKELLLSLCINVTKQTKLAIGDSSDAYSEVIIKLFDKSKTYISKEVVTQSMNP